MDIAIPKLVLLSMSNSAIKLNKKNRREAAKSENREMVQIIFDCVLFLLKQGLLFRGHDESQAASNRGNFLELIRFVARYCPQLQKWFDSHPRNVTCMSSEIQDEMISIVVNKIQGHSYRSGSCRTNVRARTLIFHNSI